MARTRSFTPHHRDSRPASKTPAGVANAHVAAARQAASIGDITICPAVPPAGAVLTYDAAHYGGWT